jgi:hypothetical protein
MPASIGNPIRYNDPSGHYGEDVHYYLTYAVVYNVGIDASDEQGYSPQGVRNFAANLASEVANGDMAADAMRVENGVVKSAPEYIRANNPVRPPGMEAPDLSIAPHW